MNLETFNKNTQNKAIMDKYLNFLNKSNSETFLVIQVPESKYDDWEILNICRGFVYLSHENRKLLSKIEDNNDLFY